MGEAIIAVRDQALLTAALERGFTSFLFDKDPGELRSLAKFTAYVLDGDRLLRDGKPVGTRVRIASPQDQERARSRAGRDELLLVEVADWKVIPLENLIAALQGSSTRIVAEARSAEEARTFLTTLEVGVHGVLLRPRDRAELDALRSVLDDLATERVRLEQAEVVEVKPAGMGDRVCIDTASLMRPGEGILVGSQSGGLFLMHSEAVESGYVASRPFRVNAGPVHAYVLAPGGRTRYLSELRAGDEVLIVAPDGGTRRGVVGRVKIESRPLLVVRARVGERELVSLVQNAETIRLVTPQGAKSVVDLQRGDKVLVRVEDVGRHFGMAVKETVTER
ncbi:MAG: 3-dehydroquinate synthase II [Halobacteriales archaeon]|nr:3-dehydroquinate synthase II [Halobacteriales archaeon]